MIKIKRAYEKAEKKDGYRVLVDRLWPRGIKKDKLNHDEWAKELSPSKELRQDFNHRPENWLLFRAKYKKELRKKEAKDKLQELARLAKRKTITLVYGARNEECNNAVVLQEILQKKLKRSSQ